MALIGVVSMGIKHSRRRLRALVIAGVAGFVFAAGSALPADAGPPFPDRLEVRVQASASLAPDGQSINVQVLVVDFGDRMARLRDGGQAVDVASLRVHASCSSPTIPSSS